MQDGTRSHAFHSTHQDHSRGDNEWHQHDSPQCWQPPHTELSKFDVTNLLDWLKDCDYYFHVSHTPDLYKVQTVLSFLVDEACQ
jgi:hypothetical protein